jgi:HlyD family secretion protein
MDLEPLKIDRTEPVRSSRRQRNRWVAPAVVLLLVVGLGWLFRGPILGFVDGLRLPEVRTVVVRRSSPISAAAATGTSANGYVVAKTRAALSADTPGRIVSLNVEEGTVVKKGDIVARLYSDEYAALLRAAEADLVLAQSGIGRARAERKVDEDELLRLRAAQMSAEADIGRAQSIQTLAGLEFKRATKLLAEQVDTVERVDRAKAGLDAAQAGVELAKAQLETAVRATAQGESRLAVADVAAQQAAARVTVSTAMRDQAKATLDKTEVRAPFDGIVVLKDAEVGEVVSPNVQGGSNARGSVVTMVDFASLEVEAEVPETSLSAVVIGRPAKIYLDAFPDAPYPARVSRIWPTANRSKATVEVRVEFLRRDDKLRPEMGVRVVFEGEGAREAASSNASADAAPAKPVLLVPLEAVVKSGGEQGVFLVERDRVRFQKVKLGPESNGRSVVEEGITDGDRIVLGPPSTLESGDRIREKSGS